MEYKAIQAILDVLADISESLKTIAAQKVLYSKTPEFYDTKSEGPNAIAGQEKLFPEVEGEGASKEADLSTGASDPGEESEDDLLTAVKSRDGEIDSDEGSDILL